MTVKEKEDIIKAAIKGSLVGGALGAALTGKGKWTLVAALVGAAILASIKAQEEAKNIAIPVMYEEDGAIYKVYPNGKKEFVKKLKKSDIDIPLKFTIG